jgi:hypothetical protein
MANTYSNSTRRVSWRRRPRDTTAGHGPGLLRRANRNVTELPSTGRLLGVLDDTGSTRGVSRPEYWLCGAAREGMFAGYPNYGDLDDPSCHAAFSEPKALQDPPVRTGKCVQIGAWW